MNEPSIEPHLDEPPDETLDALLGINLNKPSVESPPDESPNEPLNEPPDINLVS